MAVKSDSDLTDDAGNDRKRVRAYQPGAPRYACDYDYCKSTFSRLEHLKRHKLIHEAVLPFRCQYCQRPFSRKDILTRHVRRQHSEEVDAGGLKVARKPFNGDTASATNVASVTDVSSNMNGHSLLQLSSGFTPLSAERGASGAQSGALSAQGGSLTAGGDALTAEGDVVSTHNPLVTHNTVKSPFSETTHSPDGILGNSNQAVSYLLNEDFMNWLFANSPRHSPTPANATYNNKSLQDTDPNYDFPLPSFLLFPQEEKAYEYECKESACHRIRAVINLPPGNEALVDRYISPAYITYAVDIYWKLHNRWPILHRPSFRVNDCPTPLLISMITFAMYLTNDNGAMDLAIKLHDTLRFTVYMLPEFKGPTAIWVFQTLLLAEIFEMMTSTEEQHDMAIRFHNVLIASMRKGGTMGDESQTASAEEGRESTDPDDFDNKEWRQFIKHEMKKRIAFFAFVLDTQHSAFFNHPPTVFISDLPFKLPCEEALWEADAETWSRIKHDYAPPPSFTHTISSFLKLQNNNNQLTPWSMMIILHGLVSVGWNIRLRESIVPETSGDPAATPNGHAQLRWIHIISESYYGWLRHYRIAFIMNGKLPFNHPYIMGCLTTYEFAHIILNANTQDMQYAMAVLADPSAYMSRAHRSMIQKAQYSLNQWVNSQASLAALTHALDLLEMFLMGEQRYDVRRDTAFHRPWGLYMATVTVWVYQFLVGYQQQPPKTGPLPLVVYLGSVRAIVSKRGFEAGDAPVAGIALDSVDRKAINGCQANLLLQHVLDLLSPCRWGVLQAKLRVFERLLGQEPSMQVRGL